MTWEEMCMVDPRLLHVEDFAEDVGVDPSYKTYEEVKEMLEGLVGWGADKLELSTNQAYETAIDYLSPMVCP